MSLSNKVFAPSKAVFRSKIKTGMERICPLHPKIMTTLRQCQCTDVNDDVFPNREGKVMPVNNLRKALIRYAKGAGIPVISFHGLRHTFATLCSEMRAIAFDFQNLLGHTCIKTTERYVHPTRSNLCAVVQRL